MPLYFDLKKNPNKKRIVSGLQNLRTALAKEIPEQKASTLRIATWNIREFGNTKGGGRTDDAYFFIAEIISRFDIVALQEVREDMQALRRVEDILGREWKKVYTDVTDRTGTQGNGERMVYLYDSRKVTFSGLAGEAVLTGKKDDVPPKQFVRTPFLCGFQSGWTKINLCTVHLIYGKGGTAKKEPQARLDEIAKLVGFIGKRAKDDQKFNKSNWVLLGDFNIIGEETDGYKILRSEGFDVPPKLQKRKGSNLKKDKWYDQIAVHEVQNQFEILSAGVFDWQPHVFNKPEDYQAELDALAAKKKPTPPSAPTDDEDDEDLSKFATWITYQMSDHLPLWMELRTDFADEYLATLQLP